MPDVPIWLDRLDRATNYRELQDIFSEIAAQASAGGEHAELARNIDEDRVSKWLNDQSRAVDQERIAAYGRREAMWRRRCLELLGDPLVNEACAGGLPK